MSTPVTATWKALIGGRYVLVDSAGSSRGTFQRAGKTLRDAVAVISDVEWRLTQRGTGTTRSLTATDSTGGSIAHLEVGSTLWAGSATIDGVGVLTVRRRRGLRSNFTFDTPQMQVLTATKQGRHTELAFLADVPDRAPVLLPLALMLVQTHHRATSN